jgi:hypothetical protein
VGIWWEKWNLKINNLPVIWRNIEKAWTIAATMGEWLNVFNAKINKKNRNAIPFLGNATCHPKVTLSYVKIAWFPANATTWIWVLFTHLNRTTDNF